jgi:hypothetical protein
MTANELAHDQEHRLETWLYVRPALDPIMGAAAIGAACFLLEGPMPAVKWILQLLAFVSFTLAAFGVQSRVNLVAAGLALWVSTLLF